MNIVDSSNLAHAWVSELQRRLPLFGHRNWIVIADAAYPHQSAAGITTVVADGDLLAVAERVLSLIQQTKHIRATVYTDRELKFVDEHDAPGVTAFRERLEHLLQKDEIKQLAHEEIIAKLDQAARVFSILIVKTKTVIPYTSVFLELGCGYWDAAAEDRLRKAING